MQFNYRIGNIEARTALTRNTIEIVQWSAGHCWVIAQFEKQRDTDQWNTILVGDRCFDEHVNWHHLRQLIEASIALLKKEGDA